ncbi:MAG TPA: hypothetical protein VJZ68_05685 [Nitrososphaera sp.]|nr:hypothetical protein [Nitrososphaera sp.]
MENKQFFKIAADPACQQNASEAEYTCPVCKAAFKEKILLAIHIGTKQ